MRVRSSRDTAPIPSSSSAASPSTRARSGERRSSASMKLSNASVRTTKPGGTGMPARCSSPRLPPLPPTLGRSSRPISRNQLMYFATCTVRFQSGQQRDDAASTVDANPLAILDLRGGIAGAHHGRQPVLARDDGSVAHGTADVGYGGANFLKDGCPGWIRDMADENIPLLQTRNLFYRFHDACDSFHHP